MVKRIIYIIMLFGIVILYYCATKEGFSYNLIEHPLMFGVFTSFLVLLAIVAGIARFKGRF